MCDTDTTAPGETFVLGDTPRDGKGFAWQVEFLPGIYMYAKSRPGVWARFWAFVFFGHRYEALDEDGWVLEKGWGDDE